MRPSLATQLGPLRLNNPIIAASGTFGYGKELSQLLSVSKLGAIITKTITLRPRMGNPPPRLVETKCGIINTIGLENPGVEEFCRSYLPYLRRLKTIRIVSLAGETPNEFSELARKLDRAKGIDALELNISCPNLGKHRTIIGKSPPLTHQVVRLTRRATHLPLIVKLSPEASDIVRIARTALAAGANIISLINTLRALSIDWRKRQSRLGNVTGGLSGPAIKPIALNMVRQVVMETKAPVIGIGGIMNGEDVLEFLVAGASAVAIGTAHIVDPIASLRILDETKQLLRQEKIKSVRGIIGSLKPTS